MNQSYMSNVTWSKLGIQMFHSAFWNCCLSNRKACLQNPAAILLKGYIFTGPAQLGKHWKRCPSNKNCVYVKYYSSSNSNTTEIQLTCTSILRPLHRSIGVSQHPQLRTEGFCYSSFTAHKPLLTATSAFALGRKSQSSPK